MEARFTDSVFFDVNKMRVIYEWPVSLRVDAIVIIRNAISHAKSSRGQEQTSAIFNPSI